MRPRDLIVALAWVFVALTGAASAEPCRYDFELATFVGDCGGSSASGIGNSAQCNQEEARINIDWVFTDVGATRTFQTYLNQGNSPLDSVLGAQGHNANAQQSIRNCSGWAADYIGSRYAEAIRGLRGTPRQVGATTGQLCLRCYNATCWINRCDMNWRNCSATGGTCWPADRAGCPPYPYCPG